MAESPIQPPQDAILNKPEPTGNGSGNKPPERPTDERAAENNRENNRNNPGNQEAQRREAYRSQMAESATSVLDNFAKRVFQNGSRIHEDREAVFKGTGHLIEGEEMARGASETINRTDNNPDVADMSYLARTMEGSMGDAIAIARRNFNPHGTTAENEFLDWLKPVAGDLRRGGIDNISQRLHAAAAEPDLKKRGKILDEINTETKLLTSTIVDSSRDFSRQNMRNGSDIAERTVNAVKQADRILDVVQSGRGNVPDAIKQRLWNQIGDARNQVVRFNIGAEDPIENISFSYRQLEEAGLDLDKTMSEILTGILDPDKNTQPVEGAQPEDTPKESA